MNKLSWDDLRLFLAVARARRFVGAGRNLGINHATVIRRLSALEASIGTRLIDRSRRGLTLTQAGAVLFEHAEQAERAFDSGVAAAIGEGGGVMTGVVRLATPEALGTHVIAPAMAAFHAAHTGIILELTPESRFVSLANRDADIAITLDRPDSGRLVSRRLVDYRLGLYASADYLARHGAVTQANIADHPFVGYIEEMIDLPGLRYLRELPVKPRTMFRSTSSVAQETAVAAGLGLGILHCFAASRQAGLVRVLQDEVGFVRSYWMLIHMDRRTLPRVRAVVDFIDTLVERHRATF